MSNGIVNFRADIISEPMNLPIEHRVIESGDPVPSKDIHVDMGQISETQFSVVGETATPVMFELRLDNQDAKKKVRITFNGIASDVIYGVIGTTNPTVSIQMRDEIGNIVPINQAREYPLNPGLNVFKFTSSLIATGIPIIPIPLGTIAIFTTSYM